MSWPRSNVHKLPVPSTPAAAPKPAAMPEARSPYAFDGALSNEPGSTYVPAMPFAFAMSTWQAQITAEHLRDIPIPSLHALSVDWRDGALCRGAGGMAYTPHAWSQLVSLMKAVGAPAGTANVLRWLAPLSRHHAWADVVRTSRRPKGEEGIMRTFLAPAPDGGRVPAMRAVVSGRHSLTHFDDAACLKVIEELEEKPVRARITRAWNETHATFDLDSGDTDVAMSFYLRNSETGCASLSFAAALHLKVLDSTVIMPDGAKYERIVHLAAERAASRRRHTLPRYSSGSGQKLTETQRAGVARSRIGTDIETALAGSRVLAERWEAAKAEVRPSLIPLAKATTADDFAVQVLRDACLEQGLAFAEDEALTRKLAKVIAEDNRLRSLPHGSAAHLCAALTLCAQGGDGEPLSWETQVLASKLAGEMLMNGFPK